MAMFANYSGFCAKLNIFSSCGCSIMDNREGLEA
jgi:hypothetical protein